MAGNLWEIVYDEEYNSGKANKAAGGKAPIWILRGGSWNNSGLNLKASARSRTLVHLNYVNGFRCAIDYKEKK